MCSSDLGCDLSNADFSGFLFAAARLQYCSFAFATLVGAVFAGADVTGANFRGANLGRADMRGVNIESAVMTRASTIGMLEGALPRGKLRKALEG